MARKPKSDKTEAETEKPDNPVDPLPAEDSLPAGDKTDPETGDEAITDASPDTTDTPIYTSEPKKDLEDTNAESTDATAAEAGEPEAPKPDETSETPEDTGGAVIAGEPSVDETDTPLAAADDSAAPTPGEEASTDSEPTATFQHSESPPPATEIATTPPPSGGSGLFPMLLGGVIAAVVGAGILYLVQQQGIVDLGGTDKELVARVDTLQTELTEAREALQAAQSEIDALEEAEPDLSAVTEALDQQRSATEATSDALTALANRLDGTDARLQDLAVQQIPEAELPQAISDAYDEKFSELQAGLDGRFATLQEELNAKLAELESVRATAAEAESAAQRAAQLAEARAAMTEVTAALASGGSFAEPLQEVGTLSGADVPAPLSDAAETGIPTLGALRESFPEYARRALALSTEAAADEGEISPFQAFVRTQLGARSLAPRDGNDPDAVLSRAEAALSRGDLETALTEIDALPEVGRQALADWAAQAESRRTALAAADNLAAQLEQN
ncbi:hypothetical protein [Pseudoruegeria sp. HB172150]|uniref:hypothetical protein n=1 Tax=Pseudoruegeria sp. HB172150 TaxID=2721164 RepID=UPI001552B910|nr:hypothetical protein [Pseudoruegeria sp. HB172150]